MMLVPGMGELSAPAIGAFFVIMLLAGLVHGTLGLGFPLLATPLLALLVDVRSAILITLLPTVSVNVLSVVKGGGLQESVGRFWPLAAYALAGSVLGTHVLIASDPAPFKLLLAGLIVLYLASSRLGGHGLAWVGRHLRLSMLGFGILAGLAAGTTNVMVPILIIYFLELGLAPRAMVQVFNLCFLAGKLSQIGVFAGSGLLTAALLTATAPLALAAVAALVLGMRLREALPVESYRRIVRHVLLALAVLLVVQYALEP